MYKYERTAGRLARTPWWVGGLTQRADPRDCALLPQVEGQAKVCQLEGEAVGVTEQHVLCSEGPGKGEGVELDWEVVAGAAVASSLGPVPSGHH
jgi:hypothetical protein